MPTPRLAAAGDSALFVGKDRKSYIRTLTPGASLSTHLGVIRYDEVIGVAAYGDALRTHLGALVYLLTPGFQDTLEHSRHETTFIQPKDLGYLAFKLNVRAGTQVIEAGTGSGALTTWLALLVGERGHVYSYDRNPSSAESAQKHLSRTDLSATARVTFKTRDIAEGFDETDVDAIFLDVLNPWDYLDQAHAALRSAGYFGALVPTMNQVIDLVGALYSGAWFRVEVEEVILRPYKAVPARMRPEDTMVAHTGYLVFARAVNRRADAERSTSDG